MRSRQRVTGHKVQPLPVGRFAQRHHHAAHARDSCFAVCGLQDLQSRIDRRSDDEQIVIAAFCTDALVGGLRLPRFAGVDIRIVIGDAPPAAAQGDSDRAADQTQAGDQRARCGLHQGAIKMIVRSTTCDVVTSKYGR